MTELEDKLCRFVARLILIIKSDDTPDLQHQQIGDLVKQTARLLEKSPHLKSGAGKKLKRSTKSKTARVGGAP